MDDPLVDPQRGAAQRHSVAELDQPPPAQGRCGRQGAPVRFGQGGHGLTEGRKRRPIAPPPQAFGGEPGIELDPGAQEQHPALERREAKRRSQGLDRRGRRQRVGRLEDGPLIVLGRGQRRRPLAAAGVRITNRSPHRIADAAQRRQQVPPVGLDPVVVRHERYYLGNQHPHLLTHEDLTTEITESTEKEKSRTKELSFSLCILCILSVVSVISVVNSSPFPRCAIRLDPDWAWENTIFVCERQLLAQYLLSVMVEPARGEAVFCQ